MTWSYSGDPATDSKDEVRFLCGDTCETDPLVSDEEINWAISQTSSTTLAAAVVCRAIAANYSRQATEKIGDISRNCSDLAKAFSDRAKELDPNDETTGAGLTLALPSIGGRSKAEKEKLAADTDAIQPSFSRGMNDIPGGPSDAVKSNSVSDGWEW